MSKFSEKNALFRKPEHSDIFLDAAAFTQLPIEQRWEYLEH